MQRLALIGGIVAAMLAGSVARADEAAPQSGSEPALPPAQSATPSTQPAAQSAPPPTQPATPSAQTAPPPTQPATPSAQSAPPPAQPAAPSAQTAPTPPAAPSAQTALPPAQPVTLPAPTVTPPVQPTPPAVQSVAAEDAEAILGQRVTDTEGEEIGRLVDVLVDANSQPQAAVIDFGGFMGVGNRKIAVHWSALHFNPADPKNKVVLNMTQDQIKTAPEFRNPSKAASVVTPAEPAPSSP
jgi:hypothetical protein